MEGREKPEIRLVLRSHAEGFIVLKMVVGLTPGFLQAKTEENVINQVIYIIHP